MLRRLATLIVKELQNLFRHPQSARMLIVPVIIQLIIFPLVATMEVKNCTLGIYNEDPGSTATELVQRLAASPYMHRVENYYNDDSARQALDRQDVMLVVKIPPDFSSRLARGETARLQGLIDGRRSNSAQIAFGYVNTIIQDMNAELVPNLPIATAIVPRSLYNPSLEYRWFILPGLVALISSMSCLMITTLSLAREKEEGTYEQLLVTPLSIFQIMIGKTVPAIIVALAQGTIITIGAVWLYGVPFDGSLIVMYGAMLLFALAMSGIGIFISALCNTQQQAFIGTFCFLVPAIVISGLLSPVANMPAFLQHCTQWNPLTHIIHIVQGIFLKGYGLEQIGMQLRQLALIACITLSISYLVMKKQSGT